MTREVEEINGKESTIAGNSGDFENSDGDIGDDDNDTYTPDNIDMAIDKFKEEEEDKYDEENELMKEEQYKCEPSDESFVKSESQRSGRFWFWLSDDDDDDELNESGENFVKPKSQTEELNDSVDDSMKKRRRLSADRKLLGQDPEELFLPSKLRSGIK